MRNVSSLIIAVFAFGAFTVPHTTFAALAEPDDLTLVGGKFTNDTTPTFTWDSVPGATSYEVSIAGSGQEIGIGNRTSYTSSTLSDGWYAFSVRALKGGMESTWASLTFEIDTHGPTVSRVTSSVNNTKATFTVSARPDESYTSMAGCTLEIDRVVEHDMNMGSGSDFTITHVFAKKGDYSVRVRCEDTDGNVTNSPWSTVTMASGSTSTSPTTPTTTANPGDRIKTSCTARATALDVCHAVYYYGDDGKRHIFPDETTYKTWYTNFSGVKTVTSAFMAALPLGEPVTVHAGTTLVKFQSDDAIYAVSKGGVLRHYANEYLLKLDYGGLWHQFLRVLPDAWFGHYTVGSDIDDPSDYDRNRAAATVRDIDDNF